MGLLNSILIRILIFLCVWASMTHLSMDRVQNHIDHILTRYMPNVQKKGSDGFYRLILSTHCQWSAVETIVAVHLWSCSTVSPLYSLMKGSKVSDFKPNSIV